jgi:hypothetical protein
MDNITPLVPSITADCVVTLNPVQLAFYQQRSIEIQSLDGEYLETICHAVQRDNISTSNYQLRNQMYLLESLFGQMNSYIELPARAASGLADVFFRLQGFCDKHIE